MIQVLGSSATCADNANAKLDGIGIGVRDISVFNGSAGYCWTGSPKPTRNGRRNWRPPWRQRAGMTSSTAPMPPTCTAVSAATVGPTSASVWPGTATEKLLGPGGRGWRCCLLRLAGAGTAWPGCQ
jgi:hypothetical protein